MKHIERGGTAIKKPTLFFGFLLSTFLSAATFYTSFVHANPVLDHVSSGTVSISQTPSTTTVNQTSQQAIINWQSFNINHHESTHFQQPAGGVALNRINPQQGASSIYGSLTATGRIILVNPAGIYFGPTAYVNVGGIVASSLNLSDHDFLSGHYRFVGNTGGTVINQGTIIAAEHGLVALLGSQVANDGTIQANMGNVVLASGSAMTLSFAGNELIGFTVDEATTKASVSNTGTISANGGQVTVSARGAQNVLDHVINLAGVVEAKSVYGKKGSIIISGDPKGGVVRVASKVKASGKNTGEKGGNVTITGYNILLDSNAYIDVTGDAGGGNVYVGGNVQGKGPLPNANALYMASSAAIHADAITAGDGGHIILWSDTSTRVHGTISAQGGSISGNGGFIETSGKQFLDTKGIHIVTSAIAGMAGSWLLDPADLTIMNNLSGSPYEDVNVTSSSPFEPTNTGSILDVETLVSALGTGNVIVQTLNDAFAGNGDIIIGAAIDYNSAFSLTLSAFRHITSTVNNAVINNAGSGQVILRADNTGTGTGTIQLTGTTPNITATGGVKIYYNPTTFGTQDTLYTGGTAPTQYMLVQSLGTSSDAVTVSSLGSLANNSSHWTKHFALAKNIDAADTSNWNSGAGFLPIANSSSFSGLFDGLNYTLSNLFISRSSTNNVGLFGTTTSAATINNLTLENLTITGRDGVGGLIGVNAGTVNNINIIGTGGITGTFRVGSLIGNNSGTVNTITVNSDLLITSVNGGCNGCSTEIGGLIGRNTGSISNASLTLMNTGATYTVNAGSGNGGGTSSVVGGLLGFNSGSLANVSATAKIAGFSNTGGLIGSNTATINGSGNTISIGNSTTVTNLATAGSLTTGGLIGLNTGSISNIALGAISVVGASANTGGFIGNNSGTLTNVSSAAIVTGSGGTSGGLVGLNTGAISGSSSSGSVNVTGGLAGGLVGYHNSTTNALTNVSSSASVITNSNYAGGLIGYNKAPITDASFTGTVNTTASHVGGLIGFNEATGTLSGTVFNTGNVTGHAQVGGLIGNNAANIDGTASGNNIYIGNSITIAQSNTCCSQTNIGGLIGLNTGTISNFTVGAITINSLGASNVGGLIGRHNSTTATLTDVSSAASITSTGGGTIGGLVGNNAGPISNASASGNITASTSIVGGLIGLNASTGILSGTVFSSGNVTGIGAVGGLIGNNAAAINGTISGNNIYVDDNIIVTSTPTCCNFVGAGGLIGYNTGNLSNLSVNLMNTEATYTVIGTSTYSVGGLVGFNSGTLTNVSATAKVNGFARVGGLVGENTANLNGEGNSITVGSSSTVRLSGTCCGGADGGGLIGLNSGTISNISIGAVSVTGSNATNLGGLIGRNNSTTATLTNITSAALITGSVGNVGGLVGNNLAPMTDGSFTGTINTTSTAVGGLIGLNASTGTLSGTIFSTGNITGFAQLGGLIGNNAAAINGIASGNNIYLGNAITITQSGGCCGQSNIGGLIGLNTGAISNIAIGNITINSLGASNVGGVIGTHNSSTNLISHVSSSAKINGTSQNYGGLIGNNIGPVENSAAYGSVVSTSNVVGGLIGVNTGNVSTSFSTGYVSGSGTVGGFIGNNSSGTMTNNYWNTQTSGKANATGSGSSTNITGLTTANMMLAGNFIGLTFDSSNWSILSEASYPYLSFAYTNTPRVISGTVGSVGGGVDIKLAVNGNANALDTVRTGHNNFFYFLEANGTIATNDQLVIYVSGNAIKGNILTYAPSSGASLTNLSTASNTATLGYSGSGFTFTNSLLTSFKGSLSTDMLYSISGNDVSSTGTIFIANGTTYNDTINMTAGALSLGDANALGSSTLSIASGAALDIGFSNATLAYAADLTLSGTGLSNTGALTFSGTNATVNNHIVLSGHTSIGGTGSGNINGIISGNGMNLTKVGSGSIILSGINTYTGSTTLSSGTLSVGNIDALNSTSSLSIATGSTFDFSFNNATFGNTNTLTVNGTGLGGIGALTFSGSNIVLNNPITMGSNTTFGGSGTATLGAAISGGSFTLTKTGSGTLTLGAANTYSGITTVNNGVLSISAANRLGTTSGITLSGGTLQTTATMSLTPNITLSGSGGTLQSQSGILTLSGTINGAAPLTLNGSGSIIQSGIIGGSTAPTSLTTNSLSSYTANANITTAGSQTYNAPLTTTSGSTITLTINSAGGNLTIGGGLSWSGSNTVALTASANASSKILINSAITAANGTLQLSGANAAQSITTDDTNGNINVKNFTLSSGRWYQYHATLPAFVVTNNLTLSSEFLRATSGSGTPLSPYTLIDIYGVQGIGSSATLLANSYTLTNDIDASITSAWNSNLGFIPIGNNTTNFSGQFSGSNHTISNLTINRSGSQYVGLFGATSSTASISDLTVSNATIVGASNTGGIIGYNAGSANNLHFSGSISTAQFSSAIGGLIGNNIGSVNNSSSNANIVIAYSTINGGGLIGTNTGTVSNSHSSGTITPWEFGSNYGGLIGNNAYSSPSQTGELFNVYSYTNINADYSMTNLGGLVGINTNASIHESYSAGNILPRNNTAVSNAGGFIGNNTGGTITNSYSTGNVTATNNVGGLIGINTGNVSTSFSTGFVFNGTASGGFIGANNSGTMTNNYWNTNTSGKLSATGSGSASNISGLTTTNMMQSTSFTGFTFDGSHFGIIPGQSFPYLRSIYSTTPRAFSGTAASVGNGVTINLVVNGTVTDTLKTAATSFYYILKPNGAIADGANILVYISGNATKGNALATAPASGGSLSGTASGANYSGLDISSDKITYYQANGSSSISNSTFSSAFYNDSDVLYNTNSHLALNNASYTLQFNTGSGAQLSYSGIYTGSTGLTKLGAGTLVLSNANSNYTGTTTVNAGILSFDSIADVNGGNSALGAPTSIGNGTIALSGTGTLQYTGSGHTSNRIINLTGTGATIDASGSGALDLTGGVTGNTFSLHLTGTGAGSQSGAITTTSGSLTKNDNGTWTLLGTNTYTGATTINGGILSIASTGNIGLTSSISLNSGTLQSTASLTLPDVAITVGAGGGTLQASSGTLTTSSSAAINGPGILTLNGSGTAISLANSLGSSTTLGGLITSIPVILAANMTINTGAGDITFNNTIDSLTTHRTLTLNSTGTTSFNGAVGNTLALSTLTTNAGGTTSISGGSIITDGSQTYNDAVTLINDTTLSMTGSGTNVLTFANGIGGNHDLQLTGDTGDEHFSFSGTIALSSVDIAAGTGSNTLTINQSSDQTWVLSNNNTGSGTIAGVSNSISFSGIRTLIAGSGNNSLTGSKFANTWDITSTNNGNVNSAFFFSNIANLIGGSNTDSFVFSDGANVSGTIDGSGDTNTLNYAAYTSPVSIDLASGTATSTNGFSNISNFIGGTTSDNFTGLNIANTWHITSANTGDVGSATFSSFEHLIGGSNTDSFVFSDGASVSGTIDGSGNTNTLNYAAYTSAVSIHLVDSTATGTNGYSNISNFIGGTASDSFTGLNVANTWHITSANTGNVGSHTFSSFENVIGGSNTDSFVFSDGASVSGTIDGNGDTNTLNYAAYTSAVSIHLVDSTATGTNGYSNISNFIGGTGSDSFTGLNTANTWHITSANTGNVGSNTFSSFENLIGGSNTDTFVFSDNANVSGTINGSGDTNTLNYAAYTSPISISLASGTATGTNGFSNISNFIGSTASDSFTGLNIVNTWHITSANTGDVGSHTFSSFENLIGGSNTDNFVFSDGTSVSGSINGSADSNTLDYSDYTTPVTINLATGSATGTDGFSNISHVIGSSEEDTLIADHTTNTWHITANNAGDINDEAFTFSSFENLTGGDLDDTFIFADAMILTGTIDGGLFTTMNTIDLADYATPVHVTISDLADKAGSIENDTSDLITSFENISDLKSTLLPALTALTAHSLAIDIANSITLTGLGKGTVSTPSTAISFDGFQRLIAVDTSSTIVSTVPMVRSVLNKTYKIGGIPMFFENYLDSNITGLITLVDVPNRGYSSSFISSILAQLETLGSDTNTLDENVELGNKQVIDNMNNLLNGLDFSSNQSQLSIKIQ